jgi:hypothetical protein
MKTVNPLEQLIKDNWESIKSCKTPMDQAMLAIDMVYQKELQNCKADEKVQISVKKKNGNLIIHGQCVKK